MIILILILILIAVAVLILALFFGSDISYLEDFDYSEWDDE